MKENKTLKGVLFIAIVSVVFWFIYLISNFTWLYGKDTISEILNAVMFILIFIIIGSLIILFYEGIRDYIKNKEKSIKNMIPLIILLLILSANSLVYVAIYKAHPIYSVSAACNINDKKEMDDNYYFYTKSNIKLKCTKDVYEKLIIDKDVEYIFSYRYYKTFNQAVLEEIDTSNFIDNRK